MFTRITLKNSFFKEKRVPVGAVSLLLPGKEVRGMTKYDFFVFIVLLAITAVALARILG